MSWQPSYSPELPRLILWQHSGDPSWRRLVQGPGSLDDAIRSAHGNLWSRLYPRDIFNLRTANRFGLRIWAKILNVRLVFADELPGPGQSWAFGPNRQNFGHGNFSPSPDWMMALDNEGARRLLLAKWHALTSRPTIPAINDGLAILFDEEAWVDGVDQARPATINIRLGTVNARLLRAVKLNDCLPRPAGSDFRWI